MGGEEEEAEERGGEEGVGWGGNQHRHPPRPAPPKRWGGERGGAGPGPRGEPRLPREASARAGGTGSGQRRRTGIYGRSSGSGGAVWPLPSQPAPRELLLSQTRLERFGLKGPRAAPVQAPALNRDIGAQSRCPEPHGPTCPWGVPGTGLPRLGAAWAGVLLLGVTHLSLLSAPNPPHCPGAEGRFRGSSLHLHRSPCPAGPHASPRPHKQPPVPPVGAGAFLCPDTRSQFHL